jgi:hypothetical protein
MMMPRMKKDNKMDAIKQDYWYRFYTTECVLCGAGDTYKERVYDRPKPENPAERYEFEQFACPEHFL